MYLKITDGPSGTLEQLVDNAREWCKNNTTPLLVPQNNWLTLTLPPQVTMMTCSHPITQMVTTPDSQHVLCVFLENNIEMYHLSSKNLVKTFSGKDFSVTMMLIY